MANSDRKVAVRLSVEGAEQVRAALLKLGADGEAALKRINFDTSSSSGAKLWTSTIEEAQHAAAGFATELGPLGNILATTGGGFFAAAAAGGAFIAFLYKTTEAAEQLSQSQIHLQAMLRASGEASGLTASDIEGMVERISASTLQSSVDVRAAAAELLGFQNVGKASFEGVLQVAADLSAWLGTDLRSNIDLLGQAMDNPVEGIKRLHRAHIDLQPAQIAVIENLQREGDLEAAQAELLHDLEGRTRGVAAAMHDGLTGATHDLTEAWTNLLGELGRTDGVGGLVTKALDGATEALNRLNSAYRFWIWQHQHQGDASRFDYQPQPEPDNAPPPPSPRPPGTGKPVDNSLVVALRDALGDVERDIRSGATGSRSRFIADHLKTIATPFGLDEDGLRKRLGALDPKLLDQLQSALGRDYDSQNANRLGKQADQTKERQEKALADQRAYLAQLTSGQAKSYAQMIEAQDQTQLAMLRGQEGYYDASARATADWLKDRIDSIDAERDAQIVALQNKEQGWERDKAKFAEYQAALAAIEAKAQNDRDAATAEANRRRYEDTVAQQGGLHDFIVKSNEDLNISFKDTAADGLKAVEDGFLGIAEGSESVGKAFDHLVSTILSDLARIVLEKQVVGPLGKSLNDWIDGGSSLSEFGSIIGHLIGSANGNAFWDGQVVPFANGGIIQNRVVVPMSMMGEAGPEAVVPLRRGTDGKLGVASSGGSGSVAVHYAPTITINGAGMTKDEVQEVLRVHMEEHLPRAVVGIMGQARSRNVMA
ncbi:MAG: phage tail tape measure protein [Alphaproteobacteria bacterium]|nr:phage tail tape measure protein [Alphaproteobacteria bacterium]MBL6939457.1 phage tail tape measure protein [Alphaproteobacteria bacterium]MBL7097062.1 phage tail tape measure protein [Alphaproteobacteria bacterium]